MLGLGISRSQYIDTGGEFFRRRESGVSGIVTTNTYRMYCGRRIRDTPTRTHTRGHLPNNVHFNRWIPSPEGHSFVWPTFSQKLEDVIAGLEAAWAPGGSRRGDRGPSAFAGGPEVETAVRTTGLLTAGRNPGDRTDLT